MLSNANNDFGINLLKKIATNNGNHVISPLSLCSAFGMVHLGAKGISNKELREVLGYKKFNITDTDAHNAYKSLFEEIRAANKRQYRLNVANRVLVQCNYDILPEYINSLQTNYDASIQKVDFANKSKKATDIVNKFVAEKTNNKIRKMFDKPLDSSNKLVIINAVYFKGFWLKVFNSKQIQNLVFYNKGITETNVKMMNNICRYNYTRSKDLDSKIIEMPYKGSDISMFVILPHQKIGLPKLMSILTEQNFKSAIASLKQVIANLYLPKFKINLSYELKDDLLKKIGFNNIFVWKKADFSGIDGQRDLVVTKVIHKVFIEVNEKGSKDTATDVEAMSVSASEATKRMDHIVFKVDHPFIFVIRDKRSNENLFFGQITQF